VRLWDEVLARVRSLFRDRGLREVTTPVRVEAPALEPFIEPIAASGRFLATSPELAMKRLLCQRSGPIFQISHCFRAAERGALHREEFHLVEWYRTEPDEAAVRRDVEALVEVVAAVAQACLGTPAPELDGWIEHSMLDLVAESVGVRLSGDESAAELRARLDGVSPMLAGGPRVDDDDELATLLAWTSFFSAWSDRYLDGWLRARPRLGVHLVDFPPPLAALARLGRARVGQASIAAHRFESHVGGIELANGYGELADAAEQRRRFATVARLRHALGLPAVPVDERFLQALANEGLPGCCGAALGLERLVLWAANRTTLDDVAPW
jgi:lysyl-tRNA synthetase class 2